MPPFHQAPRIVGVLAVFGSAVACTESDHPSSAWVDLSLLPNETVAIARTEADVVVDDVRFELVSDEIGDWLVRHIDANDLRQREPGRYSLKTILRPVSSGALTDAPAPVRLRAGDREAVLLPPTRAVAEASTEPFGFVLHGAWMTFVLPADELLDDLRLEYSQAHGVEVDGRHRVRGHRFSGSGFAVRPGSRTTIELDIPPTSELRFATTAESILRDEKDRGAVRFRVLLGERELHVSNLDFDVDGAYEWHTVALPPAGASGASLSFEVTGDVSRTAFLAPTLSGVGGSRDPQHARPDIAIFLADTFRADNLTAHGQELDLTPNIDAFAASARHFLNARSVSTHTLSAHASLFTGNYPLQNGVWGVTTALPSTATTLAETLAAVGYRTIAITDRGMVTSDFGMAQGFEFFDSQRLDMQSTLTRTRDCLDAHDGRPLFLFVHTYRTHSPFRVSEETRAEHGESLGIEGEYDEWSDLFKRSKDQIEGPDAQHAIEAMRRLYLGTVADLDRGFGTFLEQVREFGLLERGYLILTSDHGEAFGEHQVVYHTGPVFEPLVRIPLVLAGKDIAPGTEAAQVSLVDVAPTVIQLAGLPAAETIAGRSLLGNLPPVPIFLYQCSRQERGQATVGLVDGSRKIMSSYDQLAQREIGFAFDLLTDPLELNDIGHGDLTWPAELIQRLAPHAELFMEEQHQRVDAKLSGSGVAELEALGYIGE